jgi:hypothetical protein
MTNEIAINNEQVLTEKEMNKALAFDSEMAQANNLFMNTKQIAVIQKIAGQYARSSMVPDNYRGNPDNCFVACELAARMNVSPILIMQNLWIVQGKPSWSGQSCKSLIDGCGRFSESEYVFVGELGDISFGCFMQARNKATGKIIKGTTITMQMARDEGWLNKKGSKWQTMPEQMLKYRAASFFARSECPEALMGFQTAEENIDAYGKESEKVVVTL